MGKPFSADKRTNPIFVLTMKRFPLLVSRRGPHKPFKTWVQWRTHTEECGAKDTLWFHAHLVFSVWRKEASVSANALSLELQK